MMHLSNARMVLPDEIVHGSLTVENGRIGKVRRTSPSSVPGTINLRGGFLAPGFIDLHIHGAENRDTMEATRDAFRVITEFHLRGGTTSMALTTVTAPAEDILKVLDAARPWFRKSLGGARLAGIHIEGPFISREKPGAQNPNHIRAPKEAEWKRYLSYGELITQITLAPEQQGALRLIRALKKNGSIASGGHTNATEIQLQPALAAGLNQSTHTFNAMSTATKLGPYRLAGMVEFALAHPEISCELISDGVHVAPTLMKMLFNAKGRDGVCLITDATGGAGMKPGATFQVGGVAARVTENAALTMDGTALAGSTLTMIEAVRRAVQLGGASLVDAVRMASLNPARQLRRAHELGSIEPGKRADLVWFDQGYQVRGVWLDGDLRFLA